MVREEALEGDALDVLGGVGEVVALKQADDLPDRRRLQVDSLVGLEDPVGLVLLLRLVEEHADRIVVKLALLVQEVSREQLLSLSSGAEATLDRDLHEQDLGDLVEGGGRVLLLAVPNHVVALVEQVRELVLLEDLKPRAQLLDLLLRRVRVRDVFDLFQRLGHLVVDDAPVPCLLAVVGGEEARPGEAGVVVPLAVVGRLDRDVVGLALDDDEWVLALQLVLGGPLYDEVRARLPRASSGDLELLGDLLGRVAVLVGQDSEKFLADSLLRGELHPFLADDAEDVVSADAHLVYLRISLRRHSSHVSCASRSA